MGFDFLSQAAKFLQERKEYKRWLAAFLCLAMVVVFGTVTALKLYGQAMTHQVKVLDCAYQVHEHTEDCYEENEDGEQILICGLADYVVHVHNDDCYDAKQNLVCPLEERPPHEHSDDCWEEEDVLICEKEESEGSQDEAPDNQPEENTESEETAPPEDSLEEQSEPEEDTSVTTETITELACEKEEHTHSDSCYSEGGGCEKEEHSHGEGCYEKELSCEAKEHSHGEGCYSTTETMTCDIEEHSHGDGCYDEEGNLTCESDEHSHDGGCYETSEELTCNVEEHTHGDGCYTETLTCETEEHTHDDSCAASSELTCETEEHTHDDSCYVEKEVEVEKEAEPEKAKEEPEDVSAPAEEEQHTAEEENTENPEAEEGHTHTDDCYETKTTMTCQEQELHIHDDSCYDESCFDEDGNLIEGSRVSCGLLQLEEHVHSDDCFKVVELTPEEVAALNNGANLHVHTDECFDEDGNLICGHKATHIHELDCYDEEGNLICGFDTHEHDANCYDENGNLTCGYEDAKTHEHDATCYDGESNLTCGHEGAKDHEHTAACYDEAHNLICGYEGVKDHEHDAGCYDEDGNLVCGFEDAKAHEHDASCYDEDGNLICGYEGVKAHEHDARCYDMYGTLICGYEGAVDHAHTEDCYDADGNLICGYELLGEYQNSKTFEGENYIVIAKYNSDANLPEEAELLAEEITIDSDKEHYERRESEYREMMKDETASMRALLKIGFYVEAEGEKVEVEPETPVLVSVQFLDEDGLPEGSPITVVHFAEDKTEMLDGGSAVDNSTTFQINSFSEIAIGYVTEEPPRELTSAEDGTMRLHLSDAFEYKDDAFQITFQVDGEAILPEDTAFKTVANPEGEAKEDSEEQTAEENNTEEDNKSDASTSTEESSESDQVSDVKDGTDAEDTKETDTSTESDASQNTEDVAEPEAPAEDAASTEAQPEEGTKPAPPANPKLRFKVEQLGKDSEEYQSFRTYAEERDGVEELYRIQVMTYSLTYGGEELDLSKCKVTAEIRPAQALEEAFESSVSDAAAYLLNSDGEIIQNEIETDAASTPYLVDEEADAEKKDAEATDSKDEQLPEQEDGDAQKKDAEENTDAENEVTEESDPAEDTTSEEEDISEENTVQSEQPSADEPKESEDSFNGLDTLSFSVTTMTEDQPKDLATTDYDGSGDGVLSVDLTNIPTFATRASGQPNPKFTVQYYANLEKVAYNDDSLKVFTSGGYTNELPVIDTNGGKLPKNGKGTTASPNENEIRKLYVDTATGKLKTRTELTEVYEARPYEYHKAPTINYINALIENEGYKLNELWILKKGKSAESIIREDWDVYPYNEKLHFTNRELSQGVEAGHTYVYIADNATIRLVYDTTTKDKDFEAAFYDYDIGDGKIYSSQTDAQGGNNGKSTSSQGTGTWYMRTGQQGINNPKNYTGSGAKLAFGNANTGSGLQHEKWNGNLLNKHNGTQGGHPAVTGSYKGCTFGLVDRLEGGKIQYAGGVAAPNLFNDGDAAGKKAYDNYSLKFSCVGDTHTLTAVNGAEMSGLDSFNHPKPNNTTTHYHIWTNNFWPMDSASSYGTDGHDMKFGNYARRENYKFAGQAGSQGGQAAANGTFPWSDDGQDHNSYFGMHYKVEFDLVADYTGPLEYYFFGDDDMWVFLGDGDGNGKLVCDIGGVHSSVGEYLNLWDYIDKEKEKIHRHDEETCYANGLENPPTCGYVDSKKFTLNFFYTERGESGSTCWMQFTLPSVSSLTPETKESDYGHLRVDKEVKLLANDKEYTLEEFFGENKAQSEMFENKEFKFKLKLLAPNNTTLKDDYAYIKYDKNGNVISGGGGILAWETIANGEDFILKDGEYIRIQYLPAGTRYTIIESETEITGVIYKGTEITQITAKDKEDGKEPIKKDNEMEIEGIVPSSDTSEVKYINKYSAYALPETGGSGLGVYTMAGAIVILFGAGFLYKKKFRERRA